MVLIAEVLTDLCWALVYYENSVYFNYGIGAVYGLALWPIALVIAGVIATMQNKKEALKENLIKLEAMQESDGTI